MSATVIHPSLPTGTTFIHETPGHERGRLAYFPHANNDFDFATFLPHVERLRPRVVYYMYSGLSDRGDANGGRDLAAFIRRCRELGCITIVDSHTLCGNPEQLIREGTPVPAYRLLDPLLPEVVDLVGAGDSFRAGVIGYIARNAEAFRSGELDAGEAIQFGNLMAALYIQSPLDDRYGRIRPFDEMLRMVRVNGEVG